MRVIKPKKLNKGDLIGVISPASTPDELSRIEDGVKYLQKLGYRVEVGKNVGKTHGYLAGSDDERVEDLHYMFKKKEVKAIICIRGGYGSPRLLSKLDYKLIHENPKIFVGYSDITALQMAMLHKAGLVTFAGPMLAVDLYDNVSPFTEELFWSLLTSTKKIGKVHAPNNEKLISLVKGSATGRIIGGNLALFTSIMGTEYFPDPKGKILMLEEISERPYRVDRMFNQLKLAKVFKSAAGIVLGAFCDCNEHDTEKKTLALGEVIEDYLTNLKIPTAYNFQHGHIKDFITVPFGINVTLDSGKGFVDFTESPVL